MVSRMAVIWKNQNCDADSVVGSCYPDGCWVPVHLDVHGNHADVEAAAVGVDIVAADIAAVVVDTVAAAVVGIVVGETAVVVDIAVVETEAVDKAAAAAAAGRDFSQ